MKEGWKYVMLGEVCDTINGLWKGKKEPFIKVGVIRNANFTKNFTLNYSNIEYLDVEARQFAKRKLQKGDLIVERSGGSEKQPVGRTVVFDKEDGDYSFSNFTSVLRIKDVQILSYKFVFNYILYIYLRGDMHNMQRATTGIHNIDFDKYLSIKIPLPPLSEQYQIVSFLDSEFAKIDAMKANVELALQNAKDLFQASLKEMMTPKDGWKEKMLRDISVFRNGVAHEKNIDKNGHYIVVNSKFISSNGIIKKFTSEQKSPLYKEDIVMVMSDVPNGKTLAKCFVVDKNDLYSLNQRICAFSKHKIDTRYLYHQINRNHYFLSFDNGENQTNLRKEDILDCPIFFPNSIEEQNHLAVKLDKLVFLNDVLQSNYTRIISECDALKQALLRQVFE